MDELTNLVVAPQTCLSSSLPIFLKKPMGAFTRNDYHRETDDGELGFIASGFTNILAKSELLFSIQLPHFRPRMQEHRHVSWASWAHKCLSTSKNALRIGPSMLLCMTVGTQSDQVLHCVVT